MTIDEAIEILKNTVNCIEISAHPKQFDALQLGIEAMKRVRNQRKFKLSEHIKPLPGETRGEEKEAT